MSMDQQRVMVFKFGGASISSIERIKNVGAIIGHWQHRPLMIIISAMGKTTNALEKWLRHFLPAGRRQHFNCLRV